LEARRQTQARTAVGSVLLAATPAIADANQSLAARFARTYGVSLRLFPPGQGPRDSSVFEICTPREPPSSACAAGDTLFSVQTIPPSQGDAKLAALANIAWLARLALALLLTILLATAPAGAWRWGVLILAAPYVVRYFGRGIAPPASGVSLGLWLSWQAALAVTAMAFILMAAALVRGSGDAEPQRVSAAVPAACAWGAVAAIGGLWLW